MIVQTDLFRRLKGEIDRIPAVDTHVHLDPSDPLARDLSAILGYGNYVSELIGAGAPAEIAADKDPDGRERARRLAVETRRSPASTHAWMLRETLRGAYGYEGHSLEADWQALYDRAIETRKRPGRLQEICQVAGVSKILCHMPVTFTPADPVLVPLSDMNVPTIPAPDNLARFERHTGTSVRSAGQLRDAVVNHLKRAAQAGARGMRTNISPDLTVVRVRNADVERAFDKAAMGRELDENEKNILETHALDSTAIGASEAGLVVQVFLSGRRTDGFVLPGFEERSALSLSRFAAFHPGVNFHAYCMSAAAMQEVCLCAKYLPNVYLAGCWWHSQFPEIMSSTYALRLQMLPASKWSAFFSDAYVAEWLIGKSALTRRELARALAEQVINGYMKEEEAASAARYVLKETPARLYRLG